MVGHPRPSGTPISRWLDVPDEPPFEALRQTLAIIDAVHGDGKLPRLAARVTSGRTEIGGYRFSERDGTPLRLEVSRFSDHPLLTAAHEAGHFLDHQALGHRGHYASESGHVEGVSKAIEGSVAIKGLRARVGRKDARVRLPDGSIRRHEVLQRYVRYLLRPSERFARAYAQYITVRSQNSVLIQQLNLIRGALLSGTVYYIQWADDDFSPVADAFDRLMRENGWRW